MRHYIVSLGPIAVPVCGEHVHQFLDAMPPKQRELSVLTHGPACCRVCGTG